MQVALTMVSRNVKTGPIPVSTTTAKSCPANCPLVNNGCYGAGGPVSIHWRKVTEEKAGTNWETVVNKIKHLPRGQLWRHNQVGDLPGLNNIVDKDKLFALVKANKGKQGFTYTHYPIKYNKRTIKTANRNGFIINLSGNNPSHADELFATGTGPVVSMISYSFQRHFNREGWTEILMNYRARIAKLATEAGNKLVVCPATYLDDVSCATCKLCANGKRKTIVAFLAHGVMKNKAEKIIQGN